MLADRDIEALTVAILAVGLWPAKKVRNALPSLREAGLLVPAAVAAMDLGELTMKLARNGYARGLLTSMYAERFQALMKEIARGGLDAIPEMVRNGDRDEFRTALQEIHGVGPKVAENAWSFMVGGQS